jgi:hypothetical protein
MFNGPCRLRLMATNSPVLKQFSPHVLWFSRSLRHGTHVHQFSHSSPQDILQASPVGMLVCDWQSKEGIGRSFQGPINRVM